MNCWRCNSNLPSIQRHGLLCSKSKGRLEAVWLVTEGKSS